MAESLHEEPRRLAEFLRHNAPAILAAWEQRVRYLRPAQHLDRPVLLDHMPHFIEDLAAYVSEVRAGHAAMPSNQYPRIHALTRLDLGFDVGEVVTEYQLLREALVELIVARLAPSLRSAEMPRLHAAIDLAIRESVRQYTAVRERSLRALNRISEAALDQSDVAGFLNQLLQVFSETSPAVNMVKIMLRDGDELVTRAGMGLDGDVDKQFRLRIGQGFSGRVAAERQPILLPVTDTTLSEIKSEIIRAQKPKILFGIPLLHRDDLAGVALMGSTTAFEFSDEDKLLFRTMANRATAIIVQGQLLERERAAREEAQKLAAALEVQERRLLTALAIRDQTMGVLSHDLRNPLNVIRTSAQLLERQPDADARAKVVARIRSNADHMTRMIADLLDYTLVRGEVPIHRAPMVLADVCRDVIDTMQTLYPQRRFDLSVAGDTQGDWDRDRMNRLVTNLVTNAVNYGAADGAISVTARDEGEIVALEVHNTGKPIPEDQLPRLFEAFTRVIDTGAARPQGLGLGLFIVSEIARKHGGKVEVVSTARDGTAFTVRLPRT